MACEFLSNPVQAVSLNSPVIFTSSIPCRRNLVYHEDETGIFTLRGITDQCFATYQITFNGNVALPEDSAEITPIALAISIQGQPRVPAKTDPTVSPAAVINVQNANLVFNRIA